jgi:hypothetical protein
VSASLETTSFDWRNMMILLEAPDCATLDGEPHVVLSASFFSSPYQRIDRIDFGVGAPEQAGFKATIRR